MFINIKCDKCKVSKCLMFNIDLPSAVIDNVNDYFQCVECDKTYKRQLKNEKKGDNIIKKIKI